MVYKSNVPLSTDIVSISQQDFIGNNQSVNDIWGKPPQENENVGDHIPLTEADTEKHGGHKKTTFPEQAADPATLINEVGLYSKDTSDVTELYYRRESSGDVNQITSAGGISIGGLVLRAHVLFDLTGEIIEVDRLDADGNKIKVPVSFNITSVVQNVALSSDWTITFANALPTDDYMWVFQAFIDRNFLPLSNRVVNAQPMNSATYSSVITTTTFRAFGYNVASDTVTVTPAGPVVGRFDRMLFQAYTVA